MHSMRTVFEPLPTIILSAGGLGLRLNPGPCTPALCPAPCTLHHVLCTLYPVPCALYPEPLPSTIIRQLGVGLRLVRLNVQLAPI